MHVTQDFPGRRVALTNAKLILPDQELSGASLLLRGGRIEAIVERQNLPPNTEEIDLSGHTVSPGFIDLQVNGGGGVLFNDNPSVEAIETIIATHRKFGTTACLPTLISDTAEKIKAALGASQEAEALRIPGFLGLHLEGPFLAASKRGIHDEVHFTDLDSGWLQTLTSTGLSSLLVTIAPEEVDPHAISTLCASGVRLAAGHTAASYEETNAALALGITGFTHLFNAMPPMLSRAPGPVGAALESNAWCMLIADGHHVHDAMLNLVNRAKKDGRIVLVTDAMGCVGTTADEFQLGNQTIRVENGRCVNIDGTLAGSTLTMIDAVRHMMSAARLSLDQAIRMATIEPARFLGIDHERGSLAAGQIADLAVLDSDLNVTTTVIGGDLSSLENQKIADNKR